MRSSALFHLCRLKKYSLLVPLMVMVFKTSVQTKAEVHNLAPLLDHTVGGKWTFDLDDCDKVLRIECPLSDTDAVIALLEHQGYACAELKD
jgi:hypothetical protein